jgi:hypothetical protein
MKNLKVITALFISILFLTACSKNNDENITITGDYFPSTQSSYWNYGVKTTEGNTTTPSQDFLTVKSGTATSFVLEVNSNNDANGAMSALLTNGTLNKTTSTLALNGNLEIPVDGLNDFNINFTNAMLYDLNADKNSVLSNFTNTFTKDLQGSQVTIPLTISYDLSFKKLQNQSSLKVNNVTYNKVTSGNISLNLSISATINIQGVPTSFSLLEAQDVLSINSYYGENIGLLKSDTTLKLNLNATTVELLNTLGITIDIPSSQSATNLQELTSYVIK